VLDWVLGRKKGNKKPKAGQKKTPSYDEAKGLPLKAMPRLVLNLRPMRTLHLNSSISLRQTKTPQYVKPLQKTMALLCKLTLFWPKTLISKFEKSWHIRLVASYQL